MSHLSKFEQAGSISGWYVPRDNYLFGKLTRGAGYWPDHQMRLLRRGYARYERPASEIVELERQSGYLKNPLIHYNYDTLREFCDKQDRYTEYEVRMLFENGQRARPWNLVLQPLRQFRWRYLTLRGYRDGWRGLLLSCLMAYYELVRYWRLWRWQRT